MEALPGSKAGASIGQELAWVRNPDAVAPLAARLDAGAAGSPAVAEAAGDALAAMGEPEATEAMLVWAAQVSGEEALEQAIRWFGEVRDDESFERVMKAGESYKFRDPGLLAAILAKLRKQDAEARPYVEGPGR